MRTNWEPVGKQVKAATNKTGFHPMADSAGACPRVYLRTIQPCPRTIMGARWWMTEITI